MTLRHQDTRKGKNGTQGFGRRVFSVLVSQCLSALVSLRSCAPVLLCSCALVSLCLCVSAPAFAAPGICFQQHCFSVEIADTPEAMARGLMFRDHLPDDHGMLFVFKEDGVYPFWMKNTLIPLDMIWLDSGLTVVHIETHVLPCENDPCPSYGPALVQARYVLELNAGTAEKIELSVGDQMSFARIDRVSIP